MQSNETEREGATLANLALQQGSNGTGAGPVPSGQRSESARGAENK